MPFGIRQSIFCISAAALIFSTLPAELIISHKYEVFVSGQQQNFLCSKIKRIAGIDYLASWNSGIYTFEKNILKKIHTAYPVNPVFSEYRRIIDLYADNSSIYFLTKIGACQIKNNIISNIPLQGIRGGTCFSSLVFFNGSLFLGTTYNGIYKQDGTNFISVSAGLPREKYSWNEYFYDEIRELFIMDGRLFCLTDYRKIFFEYHAENSHWTEFKEAGQADRLFCFNGQAACVFRSNAFMLSVSGKTPLPVYSGGLLKINGNSVNPGYAENYFPFKTGSKPLLPVFYDARGVFINLDYIRSEDIAVIEKMLQKKYINSLVINFKDDTGNCIYGSALPSVKAAGASMLHSRLSGFLKAVKKYNPYIIARCVVFKDYRLHKYQNGKWAVWDAENNKPWQVNKIEYWVDPYADFVHEYNIDIAAEIAERREEFGINEIQFDYIRHPSDHEAAKITYRYKKDGWEKRDVLEAFLFRAASRISLPISVDIYGYNAIYRMGNWIGQDIETISAWADAVCPMVYPSHFGSTYLADHKRGQAYAVVNFSANRGNAISWQQTIIRPFLQAFSHGTKNFGIDYIADQKQAAEDGGARGFFFWHPGSRYQILLEYFESEKP
ncbi:MAG: hypothetical protein A2096_10180 [Spirochaetes bacterium GWF1_41_5]|nr:MAG: hypothetical protein A2096_10180 [Spirochaetes bacterium GWF1_41_5]HBE03672.1 hypothetical protein [Spirochaetia bacterium]